MRIYVHGAGLTGKAAWPTQDEWDAVFVDHSAHPSARAKARAIAEQAPAEPVVVVAHSLGAVASAMAVDSGQLEASHFVLVEPALYDVARGVDAIERHIATMTRARQFAAHGDLFGYWKVVSPMMFGRPGSADRWDDDQPLAERLAGLEAPWGHGLSLETFRATPTLVVTGAWNDEYEAIAARLTAVGARHIHLAGFKHRPQDHADFNRLVAGFEAQP